jgi:superkiller protein 3
MIINNLCVSILIGSCVAFSPAYTQSSAKKFYELGIKHAELGKLDSARVDFENALKIDTLYIPAKFNLLIVMDALKDKLNTEAVVSYFQGIVLGEKDSLVQKLSKLNKSIDTDPNFGLAFNERGITYAKLGEYEKAIADYNRALEILPEFPELYLNKALSLDKLEQFEEGLKAYEDFLKYAPTEYVWYIIHARKRIWEITNTSVEEQ